MGPLGGRRTRAPGPFPRRAPPNGPGQVIIFGIPCPSRQPTHPPDQFPLKLGGDKGGRLGHEWGSAPDGGGAGITRKIPPRAAERVGPAERKPAPPRPVTNIRFASIEYEKGLTNHIPASKWDSIFFLRGKKSRDTGHWGVGGGRRGRL